MHKELVRVIFERFNVEDKKLIEQKFLKMLEYLKELDINKYEHIKDCLYVHVYGEHLSKDMAEKWVSEMKNKDGTTGQHWSIQETTEVARKHGIEFREFNEYEWYAVMNMIYSDYYGAISNELSIYTDIAKNWFGDKDTNSGKTYRYYMNVVKKH